jgi:tRNA threonylcarbamoyladenosine biosynthesis protein TsaE
VTATEDPRAEIETHGEEETRAAARRVAARLTGGERVALAGELGAGKTAFVRGLAEGLGISPGVVRSPSFTLVLPYEGGRLPLYHIDLFRLAPSALDRLALREYLYGSGVCAIEWFERLGEPLTDGLEITLTFVGPEVRRLVAVARGVRYHPLLDALKAAEYPQPC